MLPDAPETFEEIVVFLESNDDVDVVKWSKGLADAAHVYIAFYDSKRKRGLGGLMITAEEFWALKQRFGNRLRFSCTDTYPAISRKKGTKENG